MHTLVITLYRSKRTLEEPLYSCRRVNQLPLLTAGGRPRPPDRQEDFEFTIYKPTLENMPVTLGYVDLAPLCERRVIADRMSDVFREVINYSVWSVLLWLYNLPTPDLTAPPGALPPLVFPFAPQQGAPRLIHAGPPSRISFHLLDRTRGEGQRYQIRPFTINPAQVAQLICFYVWTSPDTYLVRSARAMGNLILSQGIDWWLSCHNFRADHPQDPLAVDLEGLPGKFPGALRFTEAPALKGLETALRGLSASTFRVPPPDNGALAYGSTDIDTMASVLREVTQNHTRDTAIGQILIGFRNNRGIILRETMSAEILKRAAAKLALLPIAKKTLKGIKFAEIILNPEDDNI